MKFIPPSLSAKVTWITSIVSTAVIIFTSISYSMAYFLLTQHDTRSLLVKEASEIISDQLIFTSKLELKNPSTLSQFGLRLQNFNLSLSVYDSNLSPLLEIGRKANPANLSENSIKKALTSNSINLTAYVGSDNITYETLVSPIVIQGSNRGVLILSRPYEFIKNLLQLNLVVMAFSLPLSLLFGWILSVTTIKKVFSPLNQLIEYFKQVQFGTKLSPIHFNEKPAQEIGDLALAFNDMVARVSESLEKQKIFIAHASHELKTPLTQAISSLDLAQSTQNPKYITHVIQDLLSLNHILDSLLTLSKVSDQQSQSPPATELNIKDQIDRTIIQYNGSIEDKKLVIELSIPSDQKISFPIDHFRIIFSNIFSNAIKYNKPGGKILITWSRNCLKVTDTGIGMSREEKSHMFERFYRGRANTSSVKGTGLGLALVKLIANRHGLSLSVNSSPKTGTQFSVTFPDSYLL